METPSDQQKRYTSEQKFMKAIRGIDEKSIDDHVMPDCVAVLVSELASVGETLIKQQIQQFSS